MPPSHKPWTPEDYQLAGADHLAGQGAAVLWLDPGMRKTSITLKAFTMLQERGAARKMLIVAPLKVCRLVWRQEGAKWTDFRHLKFALLHGPKKGKLLEAGDFDVALINPEGAAWLAAQYKLRGSSWPFDVVCIDEITKFKNSQSERSKALRGTPGKTPNLLRYSKYRWGLTGTPNPNGYMDLFGQFLMLDDGAALGRYITHYRDLYFTVDYNGFDYKLQPGGEKRIQAKLGPYVFALDAEQYVKLPKLLEDPIYIELPEETRVAYQAMKNHLLATLPAGKLEAANTAAAYSKMKQMSGGAVYMTAIDEDDEDELAVKAKREVVHLHDAKLEAMDELIESLDGQQLLVAYEFNHEKDRMRERYPDMAFLADAKSEAQELQMQADWNSGKIRLLACHPASAGHGLNLQEGNACHLLWFAPIWDLELWDQFIRRLRRSGNEAAAVIRHVLVVLDSIDELALQALGEKDTTQARLKRSLNTLLHDAETQATTATTQETTMVMKLSRTADAGETKAAPKGWGKTGAAAPETTAAPAPETTQATAAERPAPKGWGKPKTDNPAVETTEQRANPGAASQAERIQEKLGGEPQADEGSGGFSSNVADLKAALEAEAGDPPFEGAVARTETTDVAPKATRTRAAPASPPASGLSIQDIKDAVTAALTLNPAPAPYVRTQADEDRDHAYNVATASATLSSLAAAYKDTVVATSQLAEVDEEGALTRMTAFFTVLDALLAEL